MSTKDKLVIFDTTLRDGEQSPGASMTKDEKILYVSTAIFVLWIIWSAWGYFSG